MKKRNETIDFVRCILIVLVIIVHIVQFGDKHPAVKEGILSFMMPSFLVVTGYLVNVNKPAKDFGLYILRLLLPYVIMVLGYMAVSLYLPVRDGISAFDAATVYRVLCITSIGPYWFFRVIIICGVCYWLVFRVYSNLSLIARLCLLAALLLAVSVYTPFIDIRTAAYYFAGVAARLYLSGMDKSPMYSLWAAVPFGLLLLRPEWYDWGTGAVLASVVCFLSFASRLSRYPKEGGRLRKAMLYIGRNTFPIYVFHPIFTMASKFMEPAFLFDGSGVAHAAFTIAICIAGSIGIGLAMDRTGLSYVFGKRYIMR